MGRFNVTTPVAGYSGKVGEVTFVDGAAEVDEDHLSELAYFRAQGYGVTEVDEKPTGEPDIDALRSDAAALGIDVDSRWKAKRLQTEIDAALAADGEPDTTPTDETGDSAGDQENDQP